MDDRGARVLLVEDEAPIGMLVRRYLEREGHDVLWVRDGACARAALRDGGVDLVVCDLGLPDEDGMGIARAAAARLPVIVLTARGDEGERLRGFAAGVDDYVAKPFSPRELTARVGAVLRRARPVAPATALEVAGLRLCADTRQAWVDGLPVALTLKEFELLWALAEARGRVLTRDGLLEAIWGFAAPGATRTVDQHVAQLRAKLDRPELIATVRGLGYRLAAP